MAIDNRFRQWLAWARNDKGIQEVIGSRLGWHSILYAGALAGSVWMLTTAAKWAVPAEIRYPAGISVMVISLMLLCIETLNTLFKPMRFDKAHGNDDKA